MAFVWWVKNGAYLRLKNLQIGYSLPEHILKNTGIGRVNIYVAGTNLLISVHSNTWTPKCRRSTTVTTRNSGPTVSESIYPSNR